MVPVLLAVTALFVVLLLARISGARRIELLHRWPVVVLAFGAAFALMRGQIWFALGLAGAAAIAWYFKPERGVPRPARAKADPKDSEARAMLGVSVNATPEQIRAAYRAKMALAHPDRGGNHADAARLTAARDRLLKR